MGHQTTAPPLPSQGAQIQEFEHEQASLSPGGKVAGAGSSGRQGKALEYSEHKKIVIGLVLLGIGITLAVGFLIKRLVFKR